MNEKLIQQLKEQATLENITSGVMKAQIVVKDGLPIGIANAREVVENTEMLQNKARW